MNRLQTGGKKARTSVYPGPKTTPFRLPSSCGTGAHYLVFIDVVRVSYDTQQKAFFLDQRTCWLKSTVAHLLPCYGEHIFACTFGNSPQKKVDYKINTVPSVWRSGVWSRSCILGPYTWEMNAHHNDVPAGLRDQVMGDYTIRSKRSSNRWLPPRYLVPELGRYNILSV